jgi:hypothetical protein
MSRRTLVRAGEVALLALAAAQLIRPVFKDPPHQALLDGAQLTPEVTRVFERACQDCHSNNTQWPWYARIAPVSWMVTSDVERGRDFMNLSDWSHYSSSRKLGYLAAMADATRNRQMPPRVYSALHPNARLTAPERSLIANWAGREYRRMRASKM